MYDHLDRVFVDRPICCVVMSREKTYNLGVACRLLKDLSEKFQLWNLTAGFHLQHSYRSMIAV